MSRVFATGLLLAVALAWVVQAQTPAPVPPAAEKTDAAQLPPEEDRSEAPKEYSFNPLQSKKEVTVGEFYVRKADYRAAAIRFREATKWNDGNADAWLRLGEAEEKNGNLKDAREAYQKYLQLSPDAKNAGEIRKRIGKLI